ncbi:MAG: hypothetical protein NT124_01235 [Candidatus Dependentiae bacterium]|nr:hypothetical protein [Candidatus Dependentiae bacterium]
MRQKGIDISLLLVGLLFVCAVIGLVRGLKKEVEVEKKHFSMALSSNGAHELVPEDIIRSLQPLFVSRNIGMLAGAVNQFSPQMRCSLASIIVSGSRALIASEDKLSFLLMLARRNSNSKMVQFKMFDLMVRENLFNSYSSVLLGGAKKDYMAILPSFVAWMHHEKSTVPAFIEKKLLINEAFYSAVEQDDLSSLEMLSACGMQIDSQKASDLLVHVIYDRKKSTFIPFLVQRGADVNRVGPDRYTLLSKAVSYNDLITARTLLEAGADVDLQVDEKIGSARRIAQVSGNKELEKLLNTGAAHCHRNRSISA